MTLKVTILSSVHNALDNRIFYREATSLRKAGYEVTLTAVYPETIIKDGIKIIGLARVPRWQRPFLWLKLLRGAVKTKADIYHFHDPELLLVAPFLRLLTRTPVIYDVHEAYADFIQEKQYIPRFLRKPIAAMFQKIEPILAWFTSGLIFADDATSESFRRLSIPKVTLFNYPSIDFLEAGYETMIGKEYSNKRVVHVGSHELTRGPFLMIEAFLQVWKQLPESRLFLVGPFHPPELEFQMREKIEGYGLADVIKLTGRVDFDKIGEFLKTSSVGWVAWAPVAKHEKNIPTKLFEYMAYGLAVVSSDVPPVRLYMKKEDIGNLAIADDPHDHAQALINLLREPERIRRMGRRGQALVKERYNWSKMEPRLLDFYEKLLSDN